MEDATMKRTSLIAIIAAVVLLGYGCKEDPPIGPKNLGNINATTYVAIGDALTAGFQSGYLVKALQMYSFPNLIAQQLGTECVQPLISGEGTGVRITLLSLSPLATRKDTVRNYPENLNYAKPFNNLGVPVCTIGGVLDTSDFASRSNPYFQLVLRNPAFGKSVLDQALALNPTLITFWTGINDALIWAMYGGVQIAGINPFKEPTGELLFRAYLKAALDKIKAGAPNAQVLVGNIPTIQDLPYFTTMSYRHILHPSDNIYFVHSNGSVVQASANDKVLLSAMDLLKADFGTAQKPLPSIFVLDSDELVILGNAINAYNNAISAEVTSHGYVLVDFKSLFEGIKNSNGYSVCGEKFTMSYISGGLFSLDGMNPSCKGHAIIAGEFIRMMNSAFHANIPYPNPAFMPGVAAP
jgi:hypothetical protein